VRPLVNLHPMTIEGKAAVPNGCAHELTGEGLLRHLKRWG